jgi:hypothetical protein
LNSAEVCTDWGARSLARSSPLFEPTNYNYGAVWPFIGAFFNTAQFRHGFSLPGFQLLESDIRHAAEYGAGIVPEVFSGELNQKLAEGYHHQGFSTTGYMLPLLGGLLGLEVNALTASIALTPRLPADWDSVHIEHLAVGSHIYDVSIIQSESTRTVSLRGEEHGTASLRYVTALPPGARLRSVSCNGIPVKAGQDGSYTLHSGDRLHVLFNPVPVVLPPRFVPEPGAPNTGLRIIALREDGGRIRISAEGLSGHTYRIPIAWPELVAEITGASFRDGELEVGFPSAGREEFVRREISIIPK